MDERPGAEEDADCVPNTRVPLAWTRVDRVLARRARGKAAELEYLVKWQARARGARAACGRPIGVGLLPRRLTGRAPRLGAGGAPVHCSRRVLAFTHSGCSAPTTGPWMLAFGSWGRWLRGTHARSAGAGLCRPAAAPQRSRAERRPAGGAPTLAARAQELAHDAATWEPAASLTGEAAAAAIAALGRRRALVDEAAERRPAAQVRRPQGGGRALARALRPGGPGRAFLVNGFAERHG